MIAEARIMLHFQKSIGEALAMLSIFSGAEVVANYLGVIHYICVAYIA